MVKTKISALLLSVGMAYQTFGAVNATKLRAGFHIGLTGEINSTWIIKQTNYNTLFLFKNPTVRQSDMAYKIKSGGSIGIEAGYQFNEHWGIVIEPGINWCGQNYADNFLGPLIKGYNTPYHILDSSDSNPGRIKTTRSVGLSYFQLPIYARFQTRLSDRVNFFFMLGHQFNFRISASETVKVNDLPVTDSLGLTASQKFSGFDFGVTFQTGVDIFLTEWMYIDASLHAYYGFLDINGAALKDIGWYSKNRDTYKGSQNMYGGIHIGLHLYVNRGGYY